MKGIAGMLPFVFLCTRLINDSDSSSYSTTALVVRECRLSPCCRLLLLLLGTSTSRDRDLGVTPRRAFDEVEEDDDAPGVVRRRGAVDILLGRLIHDAVEVAETTNLFAGNHRRFMTWR